MFFASVFQNKFYFSKKKKKKANRLFTPLKKNISDFNERYWSFQYYFNSTSLHFTEFTYIIVYDCRSYTRMWIYQLLNLVNIVIFHWFCLHFNFRREVLTSGVEFANYKIMSLLKLPFFLFIYLLLLLLLFDFDYLLLLISFGYL